jgi:lysine-specific histone demethylase 1
LVLTGSPNIVNFNPPLPDWKKEAIQRLGYGNLNKVTIVVHRIHIYIIELGHRGGLK